MPFVPVEVRLQLNLVGNCPSLEDIHAAAAARGLRFDPHSFTLSPAQTPSTPSKRAARAKQLAAASQVSAGDVAEPIPVESHS
jgi:hypothetical protein